MRSNYTSRQQAADKRRFRAMLIGAGIGLVVFALAGFTWLAISLLGKAIPISQAATSTITMTSGIESTPGSLVSPTYITTTLTSTPPPTAEETLTPSPSVTLPPASLASATPTFYIVQAGDTLSAIAAQFGTSVDLLMAANNLPNDLIFAGQTLLIVWELSGSPVPTLIPASPDPAQTLTATPAPTGGASPQTHIVTSGETLEGIAAYYGLDAAALRAENYMVGDAIFPGQHLLLPPPGEVPALPAYQFSILEGNLAATYPLTWDNGSFILHYAPATYTSIDPAIVAGLVQNALVNAEAVFQAPLPHNFDVYPAGSVFAPPNRALRGRSFSSSLYYLFLQDGTGSATDQQYIAAHELTHLYSWNVFGVPVSVMLSEGAAVYAGMQTISAFDYLPLDTFCASYLQAGALPYVSSSLSFDGHNIDLENYYTAGCFVGYLIQGYGPNSFGQLYNTGNYESVYSASLLSLEADWRAFTATVPIPGWLDAASLVSQVDAVTLAYEQFFPSFNGTPIQLQAYRLLDLARLSLLAGRLSDSTGYLQAFYTLFP
jgi:LysM repeat protein